MLAHSANKNEFNSLIAAYEMPCREKKVKQTIAVTAAAAARPHSALSSGGILG
jgi:hypothetical protein